MVLSARFRSLMRRIIVALGITWTLPGMAQPSAPVLTLRPAVEISMPTEPGKVYQMQASLDLVSWQNHGGPVFGTGTPVQQPLACGTMRYFRLQVLTAPVMGDAPWSPAGVTMQLNEGLRTVRYEFRVEGHGVLQHGTTATSFTWTWLRDGAASAIADLSLAGTGASKESIRFNYAAAKAGQFTRRAYIGTRLVNSDSGSFGPAPTASSLLVPSTLTGCTFAFSESPRGSALTLNSPDSGLRHMDGTTIPFTGSWLVTGNNLAKLIAGFGPPHGEEYQFTFTSPLTGRFTRQTFTGGVFRDVDQGTFCLTTAP